MTPPTEATATGNSDLDETYVDVIVCGAGSAGSVVAARLAEDGTRSVLLLEAGGTDERETIQNPALWPANFGTDAMWNYMTTPEDALGGRPTYYPMGRGLGGGGSVNVSVWSRGHESDWNSYASLTGDNVWDYPHVLDVYRRIECYHGAPDNRRGTNGPVWVQPFAEDHPFFTAVQDAAEEVGIPRTTSLNGALMEGEEGTSMRDSTVHDGRRQSPYRSYVLPMFERTNLVVRTNTEIARVLFDENRAVGVRLVDGTVIHAREQVVLSLGAINTPKVLMQSGIGDRDELQSHGIDVINHLPGVGRNLHDHINIPVVWGVVDRVELPAPMQAATGVFWNLSSASGPAVITYVEASPVVSPNIVAGGGVPEQAVTFLVGVRLRSRGRVRLASATPADAPVIETGYFTHPDDLCDVLEVIERISAIGGSHHLAPFLGERVFPPAAADKAALELYVREGVQTFWHQCGTAAMGSDEKAVVDSRLRVHGIENLRVVDASVFPHVPVGNTMAPSVVVGEQGATFIQTDLDRSRLAASSEALN
ncbi:GMC family oxidoreductase N-terminal domain-containing protein [Glaciihabitans sp. UYNi722]|uniref:GMC family oxidoreductase n=1 Tax=Glaciihabitans sp. UYNi722 TaxID=3156344 RepID=UPI00339276B1